MFVSLQWEGELVKASAVFVPLMCFPNKLAAPAPSGSISLSTDPPHAPVSGLSSVLMGASCCVVPGRDDDCGKKLTEPLWASEDLAATGQAARGGCEWSESDAKRAVSLDATESLEGITGDASLVRTAALEDLTAIDQAQSSENVDTETDDGNAKHGQRNQSLSDAGYFPEQIDVEDGSTQLHEAQCDSPSALPDNATENSSADKDGYSKSDFSNDSETMALQSNEAGHTSPARKSLVPVAVCKGLLEVLQQGMISLVLFKYFFIFYFFNLMQLFIQYLFQFSLQNIFNQDDNLPIFLLHSTGYAATVHMHFSVSLCMHTPCITCFICLLTLN